MLPTFALPGVPCPASSLALGTMHFGTRIPRDAAFAQMDTYGAAGGTVLDTAHVYCSWLPEGVGASETTVGEWVRRSGARDQLIVATKGGHLDLQTGRPRLSPAELTADLTTSLERLQLERVDLYWFHRDNRTIPVGELLDWAAGQIAAGRIRTMGASNWTTGRLREASIWAQRHGRPDFVASQIGWSLLDAANPPPNDPTLVTMDDAAYADYVRWSRPVFAYHAQARGYFAPGKRSDPGLQARYAGPRNTRRLRALDALAALRGVSPHQLALSWFRGHPFPAVPVIGVSSLPQLQEALDSSRVNLTPTEWASLRPPATALP